MPSVLFVCTANRFRSPLAAAIFRQALEKAGGTEAWEVESAGTWTIHSLPALPEVLLIARKYGVDLSGHRSKTVSQALLACFDLILVMASGHKEALQHEFPATRERVHLLSQAAEGRSYDIPDRIDSLESMMEVGSNIYDLVQKGVREICALAMQKMTERREGT